MVGLHAAVLGELGDEVLEVQPQVLLHPDLALAVQRRIADPRDHVPFLERVVLGVAEGLRDHHAGLRAQPEPGRSASFSVVWKSSHRAGLPW